MTNYPKPITPLPWLQGTTTDVGYSATIGPCHIWTVKGPGCGLVATTAPWCQPYDAQQVDAAYIVHAANAFPHLVKALEEVRAVLSENAMLPWVERIDDALAIPYLAEAIEKMRATDNITAVRHIAERALAIARGEMKP